MKKAVIITLLLCFSLFAIKPIYEITFAQNNSDNLILHKQLTQGDAKEMLLKYNDKVDYIYQGDASQFEALKSKNLQGYVFLPNVDTDIGYFVDKNTCSIYFFHPSGYLELVGELKDN